MYAIDVKNTTIERQYNHIMGLIEEFINGKDIDAKLYIEDLSLCDETIELLLMDGYDITLIFADDMIKNILYEISWQNSIDGKKGERKYLALNATSNQHSHGNDFKSTVLSMLDSFITKDKNDDFIKDDEDLVNIPN